MNKTPILAAADLELPDDELGKLLLGLVIAAEAEARGVPFEQVTEKAAVKVVEAAKRSEATKAINSTIEKAIHKAAAGDFATAGRLLKEHMKDRALFMAALDEAVTGRRKNRDYGRRSSGDGLTESINEIVKRAHGNISEKDVLRELECLAGNGVIDEIEDQTIYFRAKDGKSELSSKISNLRGRVSTAKKKYQEENNDSR